MRQGFSLTPTTIRNRAAWVRLALAVLLVLIATASPRLVAGYDYGKDTDKDRIRGGALTAAQKTAIEAAIAAIKAMATTDPAVENRTTLDRIGSCLTEMVKEGRICQETVNQDDFASTMPENPRKCTWEGDKINVRPSVIGAAEPELSKLVAGLVHEGIHAIQWPDGSGLADTLRQREWVAHEWEVYMLDRRLAEPSLTQQQRDSIQKRRQFVAWRRDALCDKTLPNDALDKKLKECGNASSSVTAPEKTYDQKAGDSSRIVVGDNLSSYEIQTPYFRTFDVEVGFDGVGDLLFVAGTNSSGTSSGVSLYFDNTGDGLADQSTQTSLGSFGSPISLGFAGADSGGPNRLFILDSGLQTIRLVLDGGGGRPTSLQPTPFAASAAFPFLNAMISLRSGGSPSGGMSVIVSTRGDSSSELDPDRVDQQITDTNANNVGDTAAALGWKEAVVGYTPTFLNDLQAGDLSVLAAGLSARTLSVHVTDQDATFVGTQLGQVVVASSNHAAAITIPLSRALLAGEYVTVVDDVTGLHQSAGTLVAPSRPEITGTDKANYVAGETVHVFGRNFGSSPVVTLSGTVVSSTALSSTHVIFTAPSLSNVPTNLFVIEVQVGGGTSRIAGVEIDPDADGDGVPDGVDCAPVNSGVWATAGEATGIVFSTKTTFSWIAPATGGIPASMLYDVIRSPLRTSFLDPPAVCVESNDGPNTGATDLATPAVGTLFFYVVHAENVCGAGPTGHGSARNCP